MKIVHWEDAGVFVGYLEAFPDYMTQGVSLEELEESLRDIFSELLSGQIPGVRR